MKSRNYLACAAESLEEKEDRWDNIVHMNPHVQEVYQAFTETIHGVREALILNHASRNEINATYKLEDQVIDLIGKTISCTAKDAHEVSSAVFDLAMRYKQICDEMNSHDDTDDRGSE